MAVGLLGAGVFVTDPVSGYPPGTPDLSLQTSAAGRLHTLFSVLFFFCLPITCFVLGRLFGKAGEKKWAIYSVASGIAFLIMFVITSLGFGQVGGLVDYAGLFQRITLTIGWAWLMLLAIHLLRGTDHVSQE